MKVRWYWLPIAAFLGLMAFNVQAMLRAAPPTAPRAGERAAATRHAAVPPGADDDHEELAAGDVISGPGIVEPARPETRIGGALPGRIARVAVEEGARVAAGDVLVVLEDAAERAALAAAEADVAAARAQLGRVVEGSRQEDIRAAVADAETAQTRADLSRGVAERVAQVAAAGGATEDELERARRQAEADAAQARAADARRAAVLAGARRDDVRLARAQLAAAEARRDQAAAVVDRLTVRAPAAGEVLAIAYRAGEYYQPGGEPLAVIGDTSTLTVRMDVDERDLGRVAVGAAVVVRANAFPGVRFTGRVQAVGRRMGRKRLRSDEPGERNDTKVLEIVIALDDPRGLVVGQRVTCDVREAAAAAGAPR